MYIQNRWTFAQPFSNFSRMASRLAGQPIAFILACFLVFIWLITGPLYGFSDTWQLVINTTTNIAEFIMVFLIQNTQNRDGEAIQIKLDELIRSHRGAHNVLLDLEELTEDQLNEIKRKYEKLAEIARLKLSQGKVDTATNEV